MIIKKSIEIPLSRYRDQLNYAFYNYDPKEIELLTKLYDSFEQGKFKECVLFANEWKRERRELFRKIFGKFSLTFRWVMIDIQSNGNLYFRPKNWLSR